MSDRNIAPMPPPQDLEQHLLQIKATQAAQQATTQITYKEQQQTKQQAWQARHAARMQQFLDSDDPILVAEAIAWALPP